MQRRYSGFDSFVPKGAVVALVKSRCFKIDGEVYSLVRYNYDIENQVGFLFYAKEPQQSFQQFLNLTLHFVSFFTHTSLFIINYE